MPYFDPVSLLATVSPPTQNNSYLAGNNGSAFFDLPPFLDCIIGTTQFKNIKVLIRTTTTVRESSTSSFATIHPTSDGTADGTPLFSVIFFTAAIVFTDAENSSIDSIVAGVRTISADLKTITYSVAKGAAIVLGGPGLTAADANKTVQTITFGVPV